jgi:hypothetical protein
VRDEKSVALIGWPGPLPRSFPVRDVSVRDQLPRPPRPDQTSDQTGQPWYKLSVWLFAMFSYNVVHQVVVCRACRSCVVPGPSSQERHLRAEPHRLLGAILSTTVQLLSSYNLRSVEELRECKPRLEDKCPLIEHLESYDGFYCLQVACRFCTRHLPRMKKHVASIHEMEAKGHKNSALWKECKLQTYFTGHGRIDYFVVMENRNYDGEVAAPLKQVEKHLFTKLEDDYQDVKDDIRQEASVVHDFGDSRSARVPWLERTGFPSHLVGLRDEEIKSSYQLPRAAARERDAGPESNNVDLVRIVHAIEAVLRDAYALCSDTSPRRKMTQQRANILNEFYAGASGRADGFRYYKNPSTLVKYFTTFKQLLVYYYRVVYCEDGHFTWTQPDQTLPAKAIQPTAPQRQALQEIVDALHREDDAPLKHAIRRFYYHLCRAGFSLRDEKSGALIGWPDPCLAAFR